MLISLRMCLLLLFALTATAISTAAESRRSIEFTKDSLKDVQKLVAKKKAVLIDVRSKEEWDRGHIEGSIFLPVTSLRKHSFDAERLATTLPPKKQKKILYTFCAVGMRAKEAGRVLEQQGYLVRVLKPGYDQLIEAGFAKASEESSREAAAEDRPESE